MELIHNKPLLANPDIVFREEEDGAFLFDPETGDLKCLNAMGSVIWHLCDGSRTISGIEQEIRKKYPDLPVEPVHEELLSFLQGLFDVSYIGYQVADSSRLP